MSQTCRARRAEFWPELEGGKIIESETGTIELQDFLANFIPRLIRHGNPQIRIVADSSLTGWKEQVDSMDAVYSMDDEKSRLLSYETVIVCLAKDLEDVVGGVRKFYEYGEDRLGGAGRHRQGNIFPLGISKFPSGETRGCG